MNESRLPTVTLYGRPGCHLCDEAREMLRGLADGRFAIAEVDIDSNPALLREMLELIPVIEIDGVRVSTLVPDPESLLDRLDTV